MVELGLFAYVWVILVGAIIQFNPPKWYEDMNERYWLSNPKRWKEGRKWTVEGNYPAKLKVWLTSDDGEKVFEEMRNTPGFVDFFTHGQTNSTTYVQFTLR